MRRSIKRVLLTAFLCLLAGVVSPIWEELGVQQASEVGVNLGYVAIMEQKSSRNHVATEEEQW